MIKSGNGPPVNFQSLLHYLIDNYSGCVPTVGSTTLSVTLPSLPMTAKELKEFCEVDEPCMVSNKMAYVSVCLSVYLWYMACFTSIKYCVLSSLMSSLSQELSLPPVCDLGDMRKSKLIDLIIVSEAHNVCLCYSERPIVAVCVYCRSSSVFIVLLLSGFTVSSTEGLTATRGLWIILT